MIEQTACTDERLLVALEQIEILREQIESLNLELRYRNQYLQEVEQELQKTNQDLCNALSGESLDLQTLAPEKIFALKVLDNEEPIREALAVLLSAIGCGAADAQGRQLKPNEHQIEEQQQRLEPLTPSISSSRSYSTLYETPLQTSLLPTDERALLMEEQERIVGELVTTSQTLRASLRQLIVQGKELGLRNVNLRMRQLKLTAMQLA